jgi:hypothetical protein
MLVNCKLERATATSDPVARIRVHYPWTERVAY